VNPLDWSQVKSVLVGRTDHLGDFIVSTPVLKSLRKALPNSKIWVLAPRLAAPLAKHFGDQLLHPGDPLPTGLDLAWGLSPRSDTYRWLVKSKARWRAGYSYEERPLARLRCWWSLTHSWTTSLEKPLRQGLVVPHEAEVLTSFAKALGLPIEPLVPEFPISPEQVRWGLEKAQGRVALHFAARWLEGGWNFDHFCQLAQSLAPAFVTYGPAESALLGEPPHLEGVEWLGQLGLESWAALLGGAKALVSVDTGAVHLAAARGRPVVVVHLPQHQQLCSQPWYPLGVAHRHIRKAGYPETKERITEALNQLELEAAPLPPA